MRGDRVSVFASFATASLAAALAGFASSVSATPNLGCFPVLSEGVHGGTVQNDSPDPAVEHRINAAFGQVLQTGADVYQLGLTWDAIEPTAGQLNASLIDDYLMELKEMNQYVLLNLAAVNTAKLSVPADLLDPQSKGTRLRDGLKWTDEPVLSRYMAMIDAVAPVLTKHGNVFFFGTANELMGPLSASSDYETSFLGFLDAACSRLQGKPGLGTLSCGVAVEYASLVSYTGQPWADAIFNRSDATAITYYPLNGDFSVEDPSVVAGDIKAMLQHLKPDSCLLIQEAGYPSGYANASKSTDNSSQQKQAAFYQNVLDAVTGADVDPRVRAVSMFMLNDWSMETCLNFQKYYGVTNAAFVEYLCTLGVLDNNGDAKLAFQSLVAGFKKIYGTA